MTEAACDSETACLLQRHAWLRKPVHCRGVKQARLRTLRFMASTSRVTGHWPTAPSFANPLVQCVNRPYSSKHSSAARGLGNQPELWRLQT